MPVRQGLVLTVQPAGHSAYDVVAGPGIDTVLIGRQRAYDRKGILPIVISDHHAARRHCEITWDADRGWVAVDLNSTNGTQFNGTDLHQPTPLSGDDHLLIGLTRIEVRLDMTEHPVTAAPAGEGETNAP